MAKGEYLSLLLDAYLQGLCTLKELERLAKEVIYLSK